MGQQRAELTQLSHVYGTHLGAVIYFLMERLREPSPGQFIVVCGWEDSDSFLAALQRQDISATDQLKQWKNRRLKCSVLVVPNLSALASLPTVELNDTLHLVVTHYQSENEKD